MQNYWRFMTMLLYKIILHNFRQYGKREVITFPQEGLIGILGKNGAGKSTLFNAIGWVLYGKIKDVNKDMIMNTQADKKSDECYVELFFELHGVKYHVKRDIKKTNECFVKTADGTPYAIGTSNVNSYVEENLFKMDYNAFCSCYYAEQDDFDNLVKLTPAKRVQTISKLLRIDAIDKASENTRKEYRAYKTEVDEARKHLRDEVALQEEKKALQNQIFTLTAQMGAFQKEQGEIEERYKNALVKKAEGESDYKTHQELLHNITTAKKQIETLTTRNLEKDEKEYSQLLVLKNRYDEIEKYKQVYHVLKQTKEEMTQARSDFREKSKLENELGNVEKEVASYLEEYTKLKHVLNEWTSLDETMTSLEGEMTALQEEASKMKEDYQEKSFELKAKMSKMNELKNMKEKFDEMGSDSPCPTCERPLGEHYEDKLTHIKEEVNEIVSEAKSIQEELKTLERTMKEKVELLKTKNTELSHLREEQIKKNGVSERCKMVEQELSARKERVNIIKEQYEKVKNVVFDEAKFNDTEEKLTKATALYEEILRIENMIEKIPSLESAIEEVKAEIDNLNGLLGKYETEKNVLNFDEKAYEAIDSTVANLQQNLQAKKDDITKTEYTIKGLQKDISFIEEKLRENEKIVAEIKEKEEEMVILGKLDDAYKKFKSDILAKLAPTLSEIMSNDIEVMTNGKYNQIELDDEYNIYIYRQGERHPLSFYSGGEKKLAALCQRLAISNLLVSQTGQESFDMLAMDEVFGAMDNERQDSVIDMLRNLNEKFPQILIVSHSDNVKEAFDHVLEIKQDSTGNSTFDWLTEWDVSEVEELLSEYDDAEEAS